MVGMDQVKSKGGKDYYSAEREAILKEYEKYDDDDDTMSPLMTDDDGEVNMCMIKCTPMPAMLPFCKSLQFLLNF